MDTVDEHFFFFSTQMGYWGYSGLVKIDCHQLIIQSDFSDPVPPSHSDWHPGVHTPGLVLWNAEKTFPSYTHDLFFPI